METIEQAQNRLESLSMDGRNGFFRGVLWANHWISIYDELPSSSKVVNAKSDELAYEFSAYYDKVNETWRIYPSAKKIQVAEWRPIERF